MPPPDLWQRRVFLVTEACAQFLGSAPDFLATIRLTGSERASGLPARVGLFIMYLGRPGKVSTACYVAELRLQAEEESRRLGAKG